MLINPYPAELLRSIIVKYMKPDTISIIIPDNTDLPL